MTTDEREDAFGEVGELVINLMQQNAKDAAFTSNALMEGYKRDYERAELTIKMIRQGITALFAEGYMPTESAILARLYPDVPYTD